MAKTGKHELYHQSSHVRETNTHNLPPRVTQLDWSFRALPSHLNNLIYPLTAARMKAQTLSSGKARLRKRSIYFQRHLYIFFFINFIAWTHETMIKAMHRSWFYLPRTKKTSASIFTSKASLNSNPTWEIQSKLHDLFKCFMIIRILSLYWS